MSNNHYNTLESIFYIPDDVTVLHRQDLIRSTMVRIKGTVETVNAAVQTEGDIPVGDISNCLWSVYGQLEQLEQLIKFEVKE